MAICPACQASELTRADQKVNVPDTLARWEQATQVQFPRAAWDFYARPENAETQLWTCPSCGYGQFEPTVTGNKDFYEAIETSNYYNAEKWEFTRSLREVRRSGARTLLDVGCGSGHFLRKLRAEVPAVSPTGAELNDTLLTVLRGEGFGAMSSDLDQVEQEKRRFDIVCLFQILEHVADPVRFLRAFLNLVGPDGEVIITTPDSNGPIRHFNESLTEVPPHHVTRWTEAAYRALLPRLGFQILSIEREPLPRYLWDSYLPVLWNESIWPSRILDVIARQHGLETDEERMYFGADCLRAAPIEHLYGVPGHTIFVLARRSQ